MKGKVRRDVKGEIRREVKGKVRREVIGEVRRELPARFDGEEEDEVVTTKELCTSN